MSDNKDIERLFRERFKDFEADPPEYVWENVREALEEKKKRRAVPLWFRYSGIAAGLILSAFFGWQYLSGTDKGAAHSTEPAVVTAPKQPQGIEPEPIQRPASKIGNPADRGNMTLGSENAVAGSNKNSAGSSSKSTITNGKPDAGNKKGLYNKYNAVASGEKIKNAPDGELKHGQEHDGITSGNNNAVAAHGTDTHRRKASRNTNDSGNADKHKRVQQPVYNNTDEVVAENRRNAAGKNNNSARQYTRNNTPANNVNSNQDNLPFGKGSGNAVAQNNSIIDSAHKNNAVNNENINVDQPIIDKTTTPLDEKAVAETTIDTVKPEPENELEKLLKEQQQGKDKDKQIAETPAHKWNIKPQVAPVLYSSMGNGSPINQQFTDNTKSFDKDLSYGVGVNYALNERFTIRTGVNTVNLNYATQDIEFYASMETATSNVGKARHANIVVRDRSEGEMSSLVASAVSKDTYQGSMIQTTGYVEVPLEMAYALLNKKFGIQVIGGVSTLFLNENSVSVVSTQGLSTTVGEAENLNNVHFSTNLGVGFRYRFFKSFEANFEPTFKYQVNTYSRDAGNFKPYFIGLYSGISFSF